jgi:uncharacterized protein
MNDDKRTRTPEPWWKFGYVWLVVAGPCAVVVAGLVTAWIAMSSPDPLLAQDYYRRGVEINKTPGRDKAMMPALQGRNHAATAAPGR